MKKMGMNSGCLVMWTLGIVLLSGMTSIRAADSSGHLNSGDPGWIGLGQPMKDWNQSIKIRNGAALSRTKRNVLFPSGVRLCSQETLDQAMENHLRYFHLRVCQETVWEAFKIFWDRLPDQDHYQFWVGACVNGSASMTDIGSFFSRSEEHSTFIRRRVASMAGTNSECVSMTPSSPEAASRRCSSETTTVSTGLTEIAAQRGFVPGPETTLSSFSSGYYSSSEGEDVSENTEKKFPYIEKETFETEDIVTSQQVETTTPEPVTVVINKKESEHGVSLEPAHQTSAEDINEESSETTINDTLGNHVEEVLFSPDKSWTDVIFEETTGNLTELVTEARPATVVFEESGYDLHKIPADHPAEPALEVSTETVLTDVILTVPGLEDGAQIFNSVSPEYQSVSVTESWSMLTTIGEKGNINDDHKTQPYEVSSESPAVIVQEIPPNTTVIKTEEVERKDTTDSPEKVVEKITYEEDITVFPVAQYTNHHKKGNSGEASGKEIVEKAEVEEGRKIETLAEPTQSGEETPKTDVELEEGGISRVNEQEYPLEEVAAGDGEPLEETFPEEIREAEMYFEEPEVEDTNIFKEEPSEFIISEGLEDSKVEVTIKTTNEDITQLDELQSRVDVYTYTQPGVISEDEKVTTEFLAETNPHSLTEDDSALFVVVQGEGSVTTEEPWQSQSENSDEVTAGTVVSIASQSLQSSTQINPEPTTEDDSAMLEDLHGSPDVTSLEPGKMLIEVTAEEPFEFSEEATTETFGAVFAEHSLNFDIKDVTSSPSLEVTTKNLVEYNNGYSLDFPEKFPKKQEIPFDTDGSLLENNGFELKEQQENLIGNEIHDTLLRPPRPLKDQVVEMKLRLRTETFNDALRDRSTFQYQQLANKVTRKVEQAFEKLPGFKSINIVEFRPQKDLELGLVVLVHYTLTLEVDSSVGIPKDMLDFIYLQNSLVEEHFHSASEQPTVVYTITDFRNFITEALHKENFLSNNGQENQKDQGLLQNEHVLSTVKPTRQPSDTFDDDMDNALAGEKPPDAPVHEKERFLYDPFDLWKGSKNEELSENDVFLFEESTIPPPSDVLTEKTLELEQLEPDKKNVEEEGFLVNSNLDNTSSIKTQDIPTTTEPQKGIQVPLDEVSGSGFSGDGQETNFQSWQTTEGDISVDLLPPPDLEETDEGDEVQEEDWMFGLTLTNYKEDLVEIGEEIKNGPALETTLDPAVVESVHNEGTEEPFLIQTLVTPHFATTPLYHTTTGRAGVSPEETFKDEVSIQTFEASGIYDDNFLTEPQIILQHVTDAPGPEIWTDSAPLFVESTDSSVLLHVSPEVLEVTTAAASQLPDVTVWLKPAVIEEVEVLHSESPSINMSPVFLETQTVQESDINTDTLETTELQVLKDKPSLLLTEPADHQEVEVLEEQHVGVSNPSTTTASVVEMLDEDLVLDEVMVAATTISVPISTSPYTSFNHSSRVSAEEDSPFTRVSDLDPEEEDLLQHEPQIHEDIEKFPPVAPSSEPSTTGQVATVSVEDGMDNTLENSTDDLQTTFPLQEVMNKTAAPVVQASEHEVPLNGLPTIDVSFNVVQDGIVEPEGDSSGFSSGAYLSDLEAIALPTRPGRALTVFFSLRVTNMAFSMNLFNRSSIEYKALEEQFTQLLVPYLQSNLNNFQNLEILNFRNGSIVVNSRMRFGKPVSRGVTNVVYLILEDFADTAYETMNLAIDKYSLDVESGDRADPCKFQACNAFSRCSVNRWSGEAECVCDAGYVSVDGLPCQSVCDVQPNFCLNDGKCDVIKGKGAICRCRVGENWWYRGEHCEEFVSEPLVVGIAIASVAGFLLVSSSIVFFLVRALREPYGEEDSEDPVRRGEGMSIQEGAAGFSSMFETDPVTAQCYRHYSDDLAQHSCHCDSGPNKDMRDVNPNCTLSIEERNRILDLCRRDPELAEFVRQTQMMLDRRSDLKDTGPISHH